MLGLTLFKDGDFILIGDEIEIRVLKGHCNGARLGLWVPPEIKVVRGKLLVRGIVERGGDVDAMLRSIPSARAGWKGRHASYDNVINGVTNDAAFWAAEAEANRRVAM